jgi:hypothetical protein
MYRIRGLLGERRAGQAQRVDLAGEAHVGAVVLKVGFKVALELRSELPEP